MPGMKVLVILARGLRSDYLGCYGNPRVETPALDTLAANGVVFDRHFADAGEPGAAHFAWRTGRYHFHGDAPKIGVDLVPILNAKGITTSAVFDGSQPTVTAWHDGWQSVDVISASADETALERTVAAARAALLRLKSTDHWLLAVELTTCLPPWNVPAEFGEHYFRDETAEDEEEADEDEPAVDVEPLTPLPDPILGPIDVDDDTLYLCIQGSYSAAVTYLDAGLAELMRSVDEDVLVLVTSDIGCALGEHGFVGPGLPWPAESVTQLPLIARLPARTEAGLRIPALTQTVDLAPTLAAFFGVPFPDAQGHDLGPLIRGESDCLRPYAVSWTPAGEKIGRALRSPEWSFLLLAGSEEAVLSRLHVRPDDHWEVNDVRQHHLEFTEALEKTLREFEQAARQPGPLIVPPLPELEPAEQPAS
jgi:arylsulfatase A-like enzyme